MHNYVLVLLHCSYTFKHSSSRIFLQNPLRTFCMDVENGGKVWHCGDSGVPFTWLPLLKCIQDKWAKGIKDGMKACRMDHFAMTVVNVSEMNRVTWPPNHGWGREGVGGVMQETPAVDGLLACLPAMPPSRLHV